MPALSILKIVLPLILAAWFVAANWGVYYFYNKSSLCATQVSEAKEQIEGLENMLSLRDKEIQEYQVSVAKLKQDTVRAQQKHKEASLVAAKRTEQIVQYENQLKNFLTRNVNDECQAAKEIVNSYIDYRNRMRDTNPPKSGGSTGSP